MANESVQTTHPDFAPLFTDADVGKWDAMAMQFGANRRIALSVLRLSKQQCMTGHSGNLSLEEAGNALMGMEKAVADYKGHLKEMLEVAETAQARLIASLEDLIGSVGVRA